MLTDTERARVRTYLGYPDLLRDHHTRLEGILVKLSDAAIILVRESLTALTTIESLIIGSTASAGLKRVDEIAFESGGAQLAEQRMQGRMYVARISTILGVPIYCDVFGRTGYLGDKFSGYERGGAGFYGVG